jgi:predicted nucleotidyltransferase
MDNLGLSDTTICQMRSIFAKYAEISLVKIYGSRAKGNYKYQSDIDLVILDKDVSRFIVSKILLDFDDSDLPYLVDLQCYDTIKNQELKEHIDRVGKIIYSR